MNDIKKYLKGAATILLALIMALGVLPLASFAEGQDTETEAVLQEDVTLTVEDQEILPEETEELEAQTRAATGTSWDLTAGEFTVNITNAPQLDSVTAAENTSYDQTIVADAMRSDFSQIFALDISFSGSEEAVAGADPVHMAVSGGNIAGAAAGARLWLLGSSSAQEIAYTMQEDGSITFDVPADSWLGTRTFIFADPEGYDPYKDETNIGEYHVAWSFRWANGSDSMGSGKNYEYKDPVTGEEDPLYLFFHPQSATTQGAMLEVTITFTGTQDQSVPAGAVQVRIPSCVFVGWDGVKADTIETQIPQAPATNTETNYNWYLDEETNEIVLTNWNTISGDDYFHESFTFKVDPLDVAGGYPDEEKAVELGYTAPEYAISSVTGGKDIDRFCWNNTTLGTGTGEYLWKDYYVNEGINCTITIDPDTDHEDPAYYDYHNELNLAMATRSFGYMQTKPQPDGKAGVYTAWQSTWGTKPADADDYVYVVWDANYGSAPSAASNQPWLADVAYDASYPAITFGEGEDQVVLYGEQVGEMKATMTFPGVPNSTGSSNYACLTNWGGDSSRGYYTDISKDTNNGTTRAHVASYAVSSHGQIGLYGRIGIPASTTGYVRQYSRIDTPSSSDTWTSVHYAVLVRYDKSDIMDNAEAFGIDLENDGIKIYARYTGDETWESGYEHQRSAIGVAELFVAVREGGGVFTKHVGGSPTTAGAQSVLLLDEPVTLSFRSFDGARRYPYRMSYDGTSLSYTAQETDEEGNAVTVEKLNGQKIVITERWLMLSSGGATHEKGWHPEGENSSTEYTPIGPDVEDGNTILTDDDYSIPFADVETFRDYEGTYSMGTWTEAGLYPYLETNPIFVYIRYRNTEEYIPYFGFKYNSSGSLLGYLVSTDENGDPVYDENGQPVLSTKRTTVNDQHNMLPDNVTGVRYEHDTGDEVLRSVITVTMGVVLNPTDRVKEVVQADVDAGDPTYVKNIADCDVYKGTQSGDYEEWLDLDNYAGGTSVANDVLWTLTGSSPYLNVTKNVYVPEGTDAEQIAAGEEGKEICYVDLVAFNESGISTNITDSSDVKDRFKLIKGTFFELLPKGTNPQNGSFIGAYNTTWGSHQYSAKSYLDVFKPYQNAGRVVNLDGNRYILGEDEYTVSTEYIAELDQYLLRIDYEFADPGFNYCPNNTWSCYMHFYFILENSFENIRARGNSTPNYVAYMNTAEDGISKPGSSAQIIAKNLYNSDEVAQLFVSKTAEADGNAGCGKCNIPWNAVTALEANFSKTVCTPETLNGLNQSEEYVSDGGRVTVGNRYTYRLRTTNMPTARAAGIVFYDILESGIAGVSEEGNEESYWKGTFDYVDTSLIALTPTDQEGVSATCAPVVYYSTVLTQIIDINNEELRQDQLFDLSNVEIWTTECPEDKSTVTAIAIDCSKTNLQDSETGEYIDFQLSPEASLTAYIHMVAPTELPEPDPMVYTVNGAMLFIQPFDVVPGDIHTDSDILMSRSTLALRDTDVSLIKNSDPDGTIEGEVTDDLRTRVDADGTGTIVYRLTLRNTMPFDCNDIVVTDPIPEFLTFDEETGITVQLNGAASATSGTDTTGFSYELADDGRSFTFHITQQHPTTFQKDEEGNTVYDENGEPLVDANKDTVIYIPTTVDALIDEEGNQVFARNYDNTAVLVEANSKEQNEPTDTMYHRAETLLINVEKEWDDRDDFDGIRPESITLTLHSSYVAGQDETGAAIVVENVVTDENGAELTVELTAESDWKGSFENLPKYYIDTENADYDNPNEWYEISYSVEEEPFYEVAEGIEYPYTVTYGDLTEESEGTYSILVTNTHVPETVEYSGIKEWVDEENCPDRQEVAVIELYAGSSCIKTDVASAGTNWSWSFKDLPKYEYVIEDGVLTEVNEIVYHVDETAIPHYEAVIEQNEDGTYTVTNRHLGRIELEKTLVGGNEQREFKFYIVFTDPEGNTPTDAVYSYIHYPPGSDEGMERTRTTNADGEVVISLLTGERALFYDLPLGWTYTVTEDSRNYTVVSEGETGTTVSDEIIQISFTNTVKPVLFKLPVKKTIEGDEPLYDQAFTFKLTAVDGAPMPDEDEVTVLGGAEGEFLPISFEEIGTYTYTVEEQDEGALGYTYAAEPKTVVVTVTDNNGQLEASYTCDEEEVEYVEFVNEYASGALKISKTVAGEAADKEKYFTFTVTLSCEGEYPYTGSKEGTIASGGSVELKHDEYIIITDLPVGTEYEVTESDNEDYVMTAEGNVGTIIADETMEAIYVNTKTPPPDTGEERLPMSVFYMLSSALALAAAWLINDRKKRNKASK